MFGEFGILGTSLALPSIVGVVSKRPITACSGWLIWLCIVREEPSTLHLSVTLEASCSIVFSSGVSMPGKLQAAGQEHPISSGHKATEGLHGSSTSWMVLQLPHPGMGQRLCKYIAGTSTFPIQTPVLCRP